MNPTQPALLPVMAQFTPPTMEEIRLQAESIGLPEIEARKFFCYYESNGWKVGRNPMRKWKSAIAHWCLVWQSRQPAASPTKGQLTGAQVMLYQKEYDRVLEAIKKIDNSVESHCSMRPEDRVRKRELVHRKKELKELLGIKY